MNSKAVRRSALRTSRCSKDKTCGGSDEVQQCDAIGAHVKLSLYVRLEIFISAAPLSWITCWPSATTSPSMPHPLPTSTRSRQSLLYPDTPTPSLDTIFPSCKQTDLFIFIRSVLPNQVRVPSGSVEALSTVMGDVRCCTLLTHHCGARLEYGYLNIGTWSYVRWHDWYFL